MAVLDAVKASRDRLSGALRGRGRFRPHLVLFVMPAFFFIPDAVQDARLLELWDDHHSQRSGRRPDLKQPGLFPFTYTAVQVKPAWPDRAQPENTSLPHPPYRDAGCCDACRRRRAPVPFNSLPGTSPRLPRARWDPQWSCACISSCLRRPTWPGGRRHLCRLDRDRTKVSSLKHDARDVLQTILRMGWFGGGAGSKQLHKSASLLRVKRAPVEAIERVTDRGRRQPVAFITPKPSPRRLQPARLYLTVRKPRMSRLPGH